MGKKIRKFNLIGKSDKAPILQAEVQFSSVSANATVFEPTSWVKNEDTDNYTEVHERRFVTSVYYKWDYCTHWYFYGEDYNKDGEADSYYHLCGVASQVNFQRAISFVRQIIEKYMDCDMADDEISDLSEKLDALLLEDFDIVEVTA